MTSYNFRKSQRIVSEDNFERVLSYKCFVCKGMLRLYSAPNEVNFSRFGVSVSKSCGNAVMRNRLKRLGREVFRHHQHEFSSGFDYILIFTQKKPKINPKNRTTNEAVYCPRYKDIEQDFLSMVQALEKKWAKKVRS
jgi:ribonuclease P protein component